MKLSLINELQSEFDKFSGLGFLVLQMDLVEIETSGKMTDIDIIPALINLLGKAFIANNQPDKVKLDLLIRK